MGSGTYFVDYYYYIHYNFLDVAGMVLTRRGSNRNSKNEKRENEKTSEFQQVIIVSRAGVLASWQG